MPGSDVARGERDVGVLRAFKSDLAQKLAADAGPGHLKLFDIKKADIGLALKSLVGELTRAAPVAGTTIVLMLPDSAWHE